MQKEDLCKDRHMGDCSLCLSLCKIIHFSFVDPSKPTNTKSRYLKDIFFLKSISKKGQQNEHVVKAPVIQQIAEVDNQLTTF